MTDKDDEPIRRGDALALFKNYTGTDFWVQQIAALPAVQPVPDCRKWWHYPIEMPLTPEGQGPAIPGKDRIGSITYEVWDQNCKTWASFGNLPDAINDAMQRNAALDVQPAPDDAKVAALVEAGNVMANALRGDYIVPGSAAAWFAARAALEGRGNE